MGRRGRVPLYEFMRRAGGDVDVDGGLPPPPPVTGGARTVRLPIGILLVAGACVVLLAVGLYAVGFHRGSSATEARLKNGLLADLDGDPAAPRARDPVATPEPKARLAPGGPADGSGTAGLGGSGGSQAEPSSGAPPHRAADAFVPGLHYLVLMQVPRDGADRFVRFCADRGLAVKAVKKDNAWLVIWLPGHASMSDPEFGRVKAEELPRLASAWRAVEPRGTDFRDAYVWKID